MLAGDKFMLEMHLRQPGFTHGACEPFTIHKEKVKNFKEVGDSRYISQNTPAKDKACFKHDMTF